MSITKLAPFAILAILGLTACPAGDDDEDTTNASLTTTIGNTNPGTGEDSSGDDSGTTPMTTAPADTGSDSGGETAAESSTGEECAETAECQEDADCGGGSCISCICVGGETAGECAPGTCDACADINMCVACTQMMGGECAEANAACNMVPECGMLIQCANMCTDPMTQQACLMECTTMYPGGVEGFNGLQACLMGTCL